MTPNGHLTNREVERLRVLAARDVPCTVIAAQIGWSPATVSRHAKGLRSKDWRAPDLDKGRRIVAAAASVPPGKRQGLADRFGYANVASFNVMLCRYRKRFAADPLVTARRRVAEAELMDGGRG